MKSKYTKYIGLSVATMLVAGITPLMAQDVATPEPIISTGNTAWMIVATALVFLMTLPGLAFFYGGLVRRKNVLNILMQCFILAAAITVEWVAFGYSNAFGSSNGALAPYIGGFDWAFLKGIGISDVSPYYISQSVDRIPHFVFIMFQCMFAIITPALIIGAFAERISFKGFFIFSLLWAVLVYNPVAHWVWSADGWLYKLGALDFAGGTVVHVNAGIAALVMALMLGKRRGVNGTPTVPHNIPFVVLGAGLLWFGWFGFNAGSGLAADGLAANAFLVTHVAAATAALTWALIEWFYHGTPSTVGIATGAVAGLVAITPAAGFVGVGGALAIGIAVSVVCFIMVSVVKHKAGYDDTLDAFGVHGVGGILGAILTGVFATASVQSAYSGAIEGNFKQVGIQLLAVVVVAVFTGVMTFILFKIIDKTVGIKVKAVVEEEGLDIYEHGESAYN
ncbi:MAG: ammonium transporter [Bacteroidales bacterium]|jgi:Amt family ammonium transporter|nr:ammonium transporter [Bacteroidales bacterium]